MGVTILGAPAALYDIHLSGPYPKLNAAGDVNPNWEAGFTPSLGFAPDSDTTATPRDIWKAVLEGAGVTTVQGFYNGINCTARKTSSGRKIDALVGLTMMPITDITGLDPGYANPSWKRVQWFRIGMAMDVGTLSPRTGLLMGALYRPITTQMWPDSVADAGTQWLGGFGIVGDSVGGWNWQVTAPQTVPPPAPPWSATVIETVSLAGPIPDASQWTMFDFIIIGGAGGRPASLEFWINDALFLTRNFVDAPAIPGLGVVSGEEVFKYIPIAQMHTATSENMYIGDWEYRAGRFTKNGRELLK